MKLLTNKFLSKRHYSIIIITILILVFSIGGPFLHSKSNPQRLAARIEVDKENARINEEISFDSSTSSGDIKSYHWTFGDDTVSDNQAPIHHYSSTGRYNVTLTIVNHDGKNDTTSIIIIIQYPDVILTRDVRRLYNVIGEVSTTQVFHVDQSVGYPSLVVQINLDYVVGNLFIVVYFFINNDGTLLYDDRPTGLWNDYQNTISISPDDIPPSEPMLDCYIYFEMGISEGYWSGGTLSFQCVYP